MPKETKKSTQIAIGGVFSGLCLLIMFLSSIFPFATYAMPAISGIMLMAVVIENGYSVALMVYASVSILSVIVVPDREAGAMFIFFFGYYPILRFKLQEIKSKLGRRTLKIVIFNVAVILAYVVLINLMGVSEVMGDMGDFGRNSMLALLGLGNIVFIVYDIALDKYIDFYNYRLKKMIS